MGFFFYPRLLKNFSQYGLSLTLPGLHQIIGVFVCLFVFVCLIKIVTSDLRIAIVGQMCTSRSTIKGFLFYTRINVNFLNA